ncbi:2-hydroxyacylsphingosine 1-beta-galactosyltransferase [Agrilus planipennis]|uniref:UDP-glucuronosyltransferase n=1 Tax=Agrilus planipennis TaxID=224129 RepID=A0A1W4XMM5_AGRPL|nr:2-hydroxyacylsphingosine 1-beta-galactosyltransferase [Agrilus planipennis]
MRNYVLCLSFSLLVCYASSANILAIFHAPSKSHHNLAVKYLRPLAERGHHITLASPHVLKNPPKNWRDVVFKDLGKDVMTDGKIMYKMAGMSSYMKEIITGTIGARFTSQFLEHPAFQDLLNLKDQFDVIIIERFMNDALLGLVHHFKAPYIWFGSMGYSRWTNDLIGNPGSPAYIPDLFLDYTSNMNLWQRFHNTFFFCFAQLHTYFSAWPQQEKLYEKYFPGAPKMKDLYYNASLVFLNTHVSIKYAVPSVPNMIEIGGYHVTPPESLPKDLKDYFDNAPNGVIYFSLGSVVQGKDMPEETRDAILRVFSNLKQKVLWKWEADVTFKVPSNVKFEKWLPQNDLLAHPNLKLFITHGGLLSTIEAVYHGVPLLTLPVFAEQLMNAAETEEYGYGLQLPFAKFDEEKFKQLLTEILNNPKYKNNVQTRSKILKDQETTPIDRAIFWTEYVIRHKGAPHLRSVTLNLKWYQYLLIDVLALAAVIVFVIYYVLKSCLSLIFNKKKNADINRHKKTN